MKSINKEIQYYQGYKYKIYPTESQKALIDRCIELNRFVYNWALEKENEQLKLYREEKTDKSFLSEYDLRRIFNKFYNIEENYWLREAPFNSLCNVFKNVINAYDAYFRKIKNHPTFKTKKDTVHSYMPQQSRCYFDHDKLRIEGLPRKGSEKIKVSCNTNLSPIDSDKICNLSIIKDRFGNYFVGFNMITNKLVSYFDDNNINKYDKILGIDLNARLDSRVVLSDGTKFAGPDIFKLRKRIKHEQRKVSRDIRRQKQLERTNPDIKPSNRSLKRKLKLSKLYNKIHNINQNFDDTVTKKIIDMNPKAIVMESLSMNSMNSRHYIAIHTAMVPFSDIIEKMEYKCNKFDIPFFKAPREFKSSHTCSRCGYEKNIHGYHTFICPKCGLKIDRDINAAINLEKFAFI